MPPDAGAPDAATTPDAAATPDAATGLAHLNFRETRGEPIAVPPDPEAVAIRLFT